MVGAVTLVYGVHLLHYTTVRQPYYRQVHASSIKAPLCAFNFPRPHSSPP